MALCWKIHCDKHVSCVGNLPFCGVQVTSRAVIYYNTEQTCTHTFDDGTTVTATVDAGKYASLQSQADADGAATADACEQAKVYPRQILDTSGWGIQDTSGAGFWET